ncbi:MAG: Rieske 2Fe-2S domain-containing protein [Betaproteobacteria bacterium]|nr:Rieske 2Fe-2S domain-containing protein [Betaproteobacteria bacterium]
MAARKRVICDSVALTEGGAGVRFTVSRDGTDQAAFAVRFDGAVHAYLNRCAHVPVEMDWMEGSFFDHSGLYIVCSTHGAAYLPDTGFCIAGPCKGRRLVPVQVDESDGQIWLIDADKT